MTAYGYARASRAKQDVEKQRDFLQTKGCDEIILETASGRNDNRKKFKALLERLTKGDSVTVRQLDRLSRRPLTLLEIREQFEQRDIALIADGKLYDFKNHTDRMLFGMQAVMAEYESDLNGERVKSAISVRKEKKGYKNVGRPAALSPRKKLEVYKALPRGESKSSQAARYGVSRSTIAKAYEEIKQKKLSQ